jgi:hypothetical protein
MMFSSYRCSNIALCQVGGVLRVPPKPLGSLMKKQKRDPD